MIERDHNEELSYFNESPPAGKGSPELAGLIFSKALLIRFQLDDPASDGVWGFAV